MTDDFKQYIFLIFIASTYMTQKGFPETFLILAIQLNRMWSVLNDYAYECYENLVNPLCGKVMSLFYII
jgi:hypothetical protein